MIKNASVESNIKSCSRHCHPCLGPPQSQLRVTRDTQFVLKIEGVIERSQKLA